MLEGILHALGAWISQVISSMGAAGIVVCMAIESACIPLPSELIMPFAGFLVSQGRFSLFGAALAGAIGCVVGSYAAYVVGQVGGRPFLLRYGRFALVTRKDVDLADRWFARHGSLAIFVSRLLPVVRTFISLPAGIARMPLAPFLLLTFAGSLPWCYALAWIGMKLGSNWASLKKYFHGIDAVVVGAVLVLGAVFLYRRVRELREEARADATG